MNILIPKSQVCLFCLIVSLCPIFAGEFSKPTNTVGDANCFGELQFTSHLGAIKLSKDEVFSFYYTYSSDPDAFSPHLGKGFFVPLLEATLIDHDYFLELTTMGGATIYVYRLPADPDRYLSLNGKNRVQKLTDERFIRENEEGFKFEYRSGRLFRAEAPSGIGLEFEYDGDVCRTLRTSSGANVITFSKSRETNAVISTVAGKYQLTYQRHPDSRRQEEDLPPDYTLKSIGWPDGNQSIFDYSEDEAGGNLKLTMSYGDASADYRWNRNTSRLVYADGATYRIEPLSKEVDYEAERRTTGAYRIHRTFDDGSWSSFNHDEGAGFSDAESSAGPTIRTHYINTRGPVFNLVRKRERIGEEGGDPVVLYEAFYDTEGKLLREVSNGAVTWYLRDGGLDISVVKDGDNMVQIDRDGRVFFSRWFGTTHETKWNANGSRRMISRHPWGEIMVRHFDSRGNLVAIPAGEKFPERYSF